MSISLDMRGEVAQITKGDGEVNAMSHVMLDAAEANAKAVVLAGRDGVFCGSFVPCFWHGPDAAAAQTCLVYPDRAAVRYDLHRECGGGGLCRLSALALGHSVPHFPGTRII